MQASREGGRRVYFSWVHLKVPALGPNTPVGTPLYPASCSPLGPFGTPLYPAPCSSTPRMSLGIETRHRRLGRRLGRHLLTYCLITTAGSVVAWAAIYLPIA